MGQTTSRGTTTTSTAPMSRPGLGAPKPAEPFISANEAIKAAQEEARKAVAEAVRQVGAPRRQPHPFETAEVNEPPRVVITDESDKGPDVAKKPTSWVPDQKVAYGPIGGGLALLIATVSARLGYEMTPLEAIVYATALIGLVQFLLPKKDGS